MSDLWRFAPLVPFSETLSFLTDIQRADAAESRTSARNARSVYQMRHLLSDAENLEAEGIFDARRVTTFRVPAWGEATEYATPLPPGTTVLATGPADWRVGGEVLLSGPARQRAVGVIAAVGSGDITLTLPTDIPVRFAAPLRVCKALAPLTGTRLEFGLSERTTSFVTQDNLNLAAHDMPVIEGLIVIDDAMVIAGGVEQGMVHPVQTIDEGFGGVVIISERAGINHRLGISFTDVGGAAIWRRRQFWHALRGRSTEFWLPSFAADLRLAASVSSAALVWRLRAPGWSAGLLTGVVLTLDDGLVRLHRKVTGVAVVGDEWEVSVAASAGRDFNTDARLSIARRMRLDSDDISLNFPMRGLMKSAAPCVGVP